MAAYASNVGAPPSVVSIPPNKSLLLVDSRYRTLEDTPYDINVNLTSALTARKLYYQTLSWSSPFFTHNLTNNEIRVQFKNDDLPNRIYVTYMMPWTMIKEYASPTSAEIEPGSYGAYLYSSLNDLRLHYANLQYPDITVNGGHSVLANVEYNYSRGFTIYFIDGTTEQPVEFRILDCSWIEFGHYIHGYGVYDPATNKFRPALYSQPDAKQFMRSYTSDTTPTLLYTRYVAVSSKELTKDRIVQPFTAANAPNFNAQLAIFATDVKNSGVYHQDYEINDTSIISVRAGTQHQFFRIYITDEFGDILKPGNPIASFFQDTEIPIEVFHDYFDASINYQSHDLLNFLCFGKTNFYDPIMPLPPGFDPNKEQISVFSGFDSESPKTIYDKGSFVGNLGVGMDQHLTIVWYYSSWGAIGESDLVPVLGTKATFNAPPGWGIGDFILIPQGTAPMSCKVNWGKIVTFTNTPQADPSHAYKLSFVFILTFVDSNRHIIKTVQVGDYQFYYTWEYGTTYIEYTLPSTMANITIPGNTYRIEGSIDTILWIDPAGAYIDDNFEYKVGFSNMVVYFSETGNIPKLDPNTFLGTPLPTDSYPYGPYNATVLKDDLLHQMEVINDF